MTDESGQILHAKDKLEALKELMIFRRDRMKERTANEWRLAIGVWAFMGAATLYVHPRPNAVMLGAVLVLIILTHVFVTMEIRQRNNLDVETAFFYSEHIECLIAIREGAPRQRPEFHPARPIVDWDIWYGGRRMKLLTDLWWTGMQVVITVGMAALCYLLIGTIDKGAQ